MNTPANSRHHGYTTIYVLIPQRLQYDQSESLMLSIWLDTHKSYHTLLNRTINIFLLILLVGTQCFSPFIMSHLHFQLSSQFFEQQDSDELDNDEGQVAMIAVQSVSINLPPIKKKHSHHFQCFLSLKKIRQMEVVVNIWGFWTLSLKHLFIRVSMVVAQG